MYQMQEAQGEGTARVRTCLLSPSRDGGCVDTDFQPSVQCDEGDPCRNCIKRKEPCVRLSPPSPSRGGRESPPLTSPPSESAWCPFEAECGPINLLHMELLHHFERYSASTLPFQEVWPKMLQLAFQVRTSAVKSSFHSLPDVEIDTSLGLVTQWLNNTAPL